MAPFTYVYLLLAVAVFVNILQFPAINSESSKSYKALHVHESDDVLTMGTVSTSVRGRWFPWIFFSRIAPNSAVYIPEDSYFDWPERIDDKLHSYGEVSQIIRTSLTSSEVLSGVSPEDFVVASIEDVLETREPYFAFAMKTDSKTPLVASPIAGMAVVDNLPFREEANFVLVEWEGTETTFHPSEEFNKPEFYGLFIEVDLLTDEIKARLLGQ